MNGEEKLTEQQLKFVSRELGLTEEEFFKKKKMTMISSSKNVPQ